MRKLYIREFVREWREKNVQYMKQDGFYIRTKVEENVFYIRTKAEENVCHYVHTENNIKE